MEKRNIKDWFIATRPWSFPASSMPVIVTLAWLYERSSHTSLTFNITNAVITLCCMVLFQAAGNVLNDYFDYKQGVDHRGAICTPSIVTGRFTEYEILYYGLTLLGAACLLGLYLWLRTDMLTLFFGLAAILSAICYSWMKFKALGDYLIFIVYALLPMLGTGFVVTGEIWIHLCLLSVPIGLITVGILHANNTRDQINDAKANISTLSLQIGLKRSIRLYQFEVLFPFVWLIVCVLMGVLPLVVLISFAALAIAWRCSKQMEGATNDGSTIARLDERTAQLQLIFSLLLSVGFCLERIIPNLIK